MIFCVHFLTNDFCDWKFQGVIAHNTYNQAIADCDILKHTEKLTLHTTFFLWELWWLYQWEIHDKTYGLVLFFPN